MLEAANARWIGCGDAECPLIRKEFNLSAPKKGVIEVTGLGYFKLLINGKSVSDELMNPAVSDYEKRDLSKLAYPLHDTLTHRIYYRRYEVSAFLKDGENTLSILLGNGWYRQMERSAEGETSFGSELKAIFALSVTDQSGEREICSDGSETFTPSFITASNLFLGETQDARLLNKALPPVPVRVLPDPASALTLQVCPSDRVIRTLTPKLLSREGEVSLYDAGENISGRVSLTVAAKSGEKVTLRFSEELSADGKALNFISTGADYTLKKSGCPQIQEDVFIGGETPVRMAPEFVWHSFRYFTVDGAGEDPVVEVIHTDVPVTSRFTSDSEALNWLYEAYIRTQLDNMHGSIPSDCPHRERLGYTGDGQIAAESAMLLLDSEAFYRKWIRDILDCQDISTGHVQHTAPLMGGGGGPGGWGGAVVIVPYQFYRRFNDLSLVEECYPHMAKWIGYMESRSEDGLVVREEEGGWCLGDWASIEKMRLPEPFVNTCYLVKCLNDLAQMADALGKGADAALWREKAKAARTAVLRRYYDPETGSFCAGIQGADAYALDIGLSEDPRTLENLDARYNELGYFDTGFLGTDILVDVLFRFGRENTAFKLLTTEKEGGYLWMKKAGATTIWEYIGRERGEECSHNHPMFGAPVRQLFTRILGITQPNAAVGFSSLLFAPVFPKGLSTAAGAMTLPCGEVEVSWERTGDTVTYKTVLPAGAKGTFLQNGVRQTLLGGENILQIKL